MMTFEDIAVCLPWTERSDTVETEPRPSLRLVKPVPEKKSGRSEAEQNYLEQMGRWHHRRQRRRNRLERLYR
jgi:hypothetical protein